MLTTDEICRVALPAFLACACGSGAHVEERKPRALSAASVDAGGPRPQINIEVDAASASAADARPEGRLGKEAIGQGIRRGTDALRNCYEPVVRMHPTRALYIKVRFVIDPHGRVSSAESLSSNSFDADVDRCILDAFRALEFPAPQDAGSVTVTYPLIVDVTGG